jgi:hypothetical protein
MRNVKREEFGGTDSRMRVNTDLDRDQPFQGNFSFQKSLADALPSLSSLFTLQD